MEERKKLSLKEEIDREAEKIRQEVEDRDDLDDIQVSDEMESSLFNKIQDYEYEKRSKVVHRRKKKRYIIFALAAVLIIVFGSMMTSVGSKSYWKVLWERMAGEDEKATVINVEDMDAKETGDIDEVHINKEIRNELGILPVRFVYVPKGMRLIEYEIVKGQNKAIILYEYNGEIIRYMMYMNNTDSSMAQTELDSLINQYDIEVGPNIIVNIEVYDIDNIINDRYVAQFEYQNAQYQLMGVMEKKEFEKIIKNLYFSSENE